MDSNAFCEMNIGFSVLSFFTNVSIVFIGLKLMEKLSDIKLMLLEINSRFAQQDTEESSDNDVEEPSEQNELENPAFSAFIEMMKEHNKNAEWNSDITRDSVLKKRKIDDTTPLESID